MPWVFAATRAALAPGTVLGVSCDGIYVDLPVRQETQA